MAKVTVPDRSEPIFDPETGQFSVRYQTFLESVAVEVDGTDDEIESAISGLESEIQKVSSFISEINKDIAELGDLDVKTSMLSSKMVQLENSIKEVFALMPDQSNVLSLVAELEKRVLTLETP